MRCLLAFAVLLVVGGKADAQMPPSFDIVGWCKDDLAAGGYAETGIAGCVALEQQKVRTLRKLYRQVPADLRAECETFAQDVTDGRGSYAVLALCIDAKQGR